GGYVTSDQCKSCHPDQYASWHQSFHRTMTTLARPETMLAHLPSGPLELDGVVYRLEQRGDEYWAELPDPSWPQDPSPEGVAQASPPRVWRRLSLITGSHHMQVF